MYQTYPDPPWQGEEPENMLHNVIIVAEVSAHVTEARSTAVLRLWQDSW